MRASKCLSLSHITPARALHRIFIAPTLSHPPLSSRLNLHQQRRTAYTSPSPSSPTKSRLPRNDEITSPTIHLVCPDTGALLPPSRTSTILSRLDPRTEILCTVAPATPDAPPICKILKKAELFKIEKEKKKGKGGKEPNKTVKGLEMNWAIERGDLGHRLSRLREWLGRGWRVEVVLAKKRKGRLATVEEAEALVGSVRGVLKECGGRENKPAEGKVGGVMTIYCEGKVVKEKEKGEGKGEEKVEDRGVEKEMGV